MLLMNIGLALGLGWFFSLLIYMVFWMSNSNYNEEDSLSQAEEDLNTVTLYMGLVFRVLAIIAYSMLLAGLKKENPRLLLPTLIFFPLNLIKMISVAIASFIIYEDENGWFVFAIFIPDLLISFCIFYNALRLRKTFGQQRNYKRQDTLRAERTRYET